MLSTGKDVYETAFSYSANKMTQSYLYKYQEPTNDYYGICRIVTSFDQAGNKIKEQYFDKNMQAATDEYGCHKYMYNSGNAADEKYAIFCEEDGDQSSAKASKIVYKPDSLGVPAMLIWTDEDDKPALNKYGCAKVITQYDNDYRLMSLKFLNENNKLCKAMNYNCAYVQFNYNTDDKPNTAKFYNADGSEAKLPECDCTRIRNTWPPYGEFNYLYDIRMNH
jgi:hypothetical protein